MKKSDSPDIDIVIAWVDGSDPVLKQKRESYKPSNAVASDAITATRFASDDEIYYNIASIIKYVPFCRHIYVVTDQQKPAFIDEFAKQNICSADKIRIVDHKEIFSGYEEYLPTFNSISIETMLWNIKGVSDYFIYMNDDFFFNQPSKIEDFLNDNHIIIIHGHWQRKILLQAKRKYRKVLTKLLNIEMQPKYTISQMLGADSLEENKFFEIHHYPHIVDTNTLKKYFSLNHSLLENQIAHRFRDISQFDPISLNNHLKIKKNEVILLPDIKLNYFKAEYSVEKFIDNLEDQSIKYGCIQSMDLLSNEASKKIKQAMMKKFFSYLPQSLFEEQDNISFRGK